MNVLWRALDHFQPTKMAFSNSSVWYLEGSRCSAVNVGIAAGFSFSVCRLRDTSLALSVHVFELTEKVFTYQESHNSALVS